MTTIKEKIPALKARLQKRRRLLLVLGCLLVAVGGLACYWLSRSSEAPPYETMTADYDAIQETVTANGTVLPVQDVVLTFQNGGYVEDCYVQLGDSVQTGEVLAVEDARDFSAQYSASVANLGNAQAGYDQIQSGQQPLLDQQQAQLRQLEAALKGAEQTLQRQTALFQAGGTSQAQLDSAQIEYDSARARYEEAEARLRQLEATQPDELDAAGSQIDYAQSQVDISARALDAARIVAPFDGYVALIQGNVGQWTSGGAPPVGTAPSSQFSIRVASRELKLSAQINDVDIGKVAVGQEVEFTVDAYPNQVFKGRLASLAPMAAESGDVDTYEAIIDGFDPGALKGGMPAAVTIKTACSDHVLTISQAALSYARSYMLKNPETEETDSTASRSEKKKASHKQYVVVLEENQPVLKEVTTGLSDEQNVEITSGLEAGATVVIGGGLVSADKDSGFSL